MHACEVAVHKPGRINTNAVTPEDAGAHVAGRLVGIDEEKLIVIEDGAATKRWWLVHPNTSDLFSRRRPGNRSWPSTEERCCCRIFLRSIPYPDIRSVTIETRNRTQFTDGSKPEVIALEHTFSSPIGPRNGLVESHETRSSEAAAKRLSVPIQASLFLIVVERAKRQEKNLKRLLSTHYDVIMSQGLQNL
jgi:hypothetical protein